ncbi:jhy protein homolog [Vidua chalybeata]|uniref:jhy protein homolog n=1 Tax=Vidua chalybeata TaxID=81927 RepID=UPI0023A88595|nr:jhy protein homolog [Vidua chalybeata]XP_053819538.1 jhy protein homolog [Vidua chalybeata]XP_053819539.1 jhy protein homolog [Vidua chalybeata]XP_053819540.1 jhy protein homolog [Vidua chalybeata]XP_053819541.1 jhy protein homolog [Vidua chalybeata]XP_053819542.1 jhy protein homolog [Vidua chalybeata]XP_053819543.1 jhy protein homolog [Vidua chalybeata]XP_053819545.1 jhy protein homolog [Vidua chalybeata]
MNPSSMKYISVSSPHTYTTNNIDVPPKILVPPVFQPASWERERSSASSLEDSQDSDSESLAKERQNQLALQQRILENQELERQEAGDILEDDIVEQDSLEEMSSEETGAEYDTKKKGKPKIYGSGRKKLPVDKYSSLRYNPHWKSAKKGVDFFEAEKASQIVGGSSGDFSLDSFYLHSDGSSENNQQEAKTQDSLPGFGPELFSFYGANVASNNPVGPQAKRKEPADGFHSKDNPGQAFPPQHQQDPPQRAKKNFVKKNKRTLGLQSEKINSYLELHNKKQQVLQGQVTDPTPVDEEPLQNVPAFQTGKMKPEDKRYPKGQQLKERHQFLQKNQTGSKQPLSGRAFPRSGGQEAPGGAAEAKPWIQQIPGFQAAPPAVGQEHSSAPNPNSSLGPAEKSQSGFNNFPNSILTTPAHHFLPVFQNFYPAEVLNPEYASKEDKKYQRDSPAGIPHQFPANAIPGQHFSRNNCSSGQAHPELGNISSDFNAIFQEKVKDQAPLPDFKNHIHEDNSSPTAACRISHFRETEEQQQPRISDFDDFAGTWLWGLFPPALPQGHRGSQGDSGSSEGNPRKMRRSSSEGSLLQREKQNQPKASKKLGSSKFCFNLSMKLGGLGPDYETIKEKKEKLKLQKEYSRQIKEYNMKNIIVLQRFLPAKPQVSSGCRQKALEYAKKIPRPKTFIARQSEQEVKEALPQAPAGTSLPKIPSLESLWSRHEKEKEVVAAFEALHIL